MINDAETQSFGERACEKQSDSDGIRMTIDTGCQRARRRQMKRNLKI